MNENTNDSWENSINKHTITPDVTSSFYLI